MAKRDYWKGKMIAVVGLGPHGEMVEDVRFLIKSGALVSIYDLKSEARVKNHLVYLRSIGLANYVCGSIPSDDLLDMDIIILSHEYPRNSSFLNAAKEKGIEIEYPETLFMKLAPPMTVVGVMGQCGKSTVMSMLSPMLEHACASEDEQRFFRIDPDRDEGILSVLKKARNGDLALFRIIPAMMPELTKLRMSPQVAIFTTVPGKDAYEESPFEILAYQTYNNFIIASDDIIDTAKDYKDLPRAKMLRTKSTLIPDDWGITFCGEHEKANAALAIQAARLFKLELDDALRILSEWKPLKGRMELIKKIKSAEYYNDCTSQNACSTSTAVRTLAKDRNIVLVFGGAKTTCDYSDLYSMLPRFVHTMVLLPGSGTLEERHKIAKINAIDVVSAPNIEEAARLAMEHAKKGDRVVFSPGCLAGGTESSTKERGERFVKAVRGL